MITKKWKALFLILIIVLILVMTVSGCTTGKGKVAVIRLSGTIADSTQQGLLMSGGISPRLVENYMLRAEHDS